MQEQLISFETAKLAKEKEFNEHGLTWLYYEENGSLFCAEYNNGNEDYICCTQSLLQKWLREVHSIKVCLWWQFHQPSHSWKWLVNVINNYNITKVNMYLDTYEESLEKGLQEALKLINIDGK